MPQNKMIDLQNYLFEEMDRLSDPDIMDDPKKAETEIEKAKTMARLGTVMVNNTRNAIEATKMTRELPQATIEQMSPLLLTGGENTHHER